MGNHSRVNWIYFLSFKTHQQLSDCKSKRLNRFHRSAASLFLGLKSENRINVIPVIGVEHFIRLKFAQAESTNVVPAIASGILPNPSQMTLYSRPNCNKGSASICNIINDCLLSRCKRNPLPIALICSSVTAERNAHATTSGASSPSSVPLSGTCIMKHQHREKGNSRSGFYCSFFHTRCDRVPYTL
jgi:hypothetical protein